MNFQLKPILSEIKELYSKPISADRFKEYISKLQGGTKGDMVLPIAGFNPMAKDHVLKKINELEELYAEKLMENTIIEFNAKLSDSTGEEIQVVLNIGDDHKGGWTNYYTTDYESKFKLNGFVSRNFCVPYFWTSESYSSDLIKIRTNEYLSRTLYRKKHPQPKTLKEHFEQEIFVASKVFSDKKDFDESSFEEIEKYYLENKASDEYKKIFNFFYGDIGSDSLGYKKYGNTGVLGFDFARLIMNSRKKIY